MHAANIKTNETLQRLRELLAFRGQGGVTSLEINEILHVLNPATEVSALRHNGYIVTCTYEGRSPAGRKVYRYRLVEE